MTITSWFSFDSCTRVVSGMPGYQSLESSILRRPGITQATRLRVLGAARTAMLVFLAIAAITLVFAVTPALAQQPTNFGSASGVTCPGGNVICNGSINFLTTELFFEPETPSDSLKKSPPTWNELEQLLDNPNYTLTWGAACNDAAGPVPGNTQGFPTYCTNSTPTAQNPTGFIRRPNFSSTITLPPFLVHPLNYSPPTGTEMRILNPNFAGDPHFKVSGTVLDNDSHTYVPTGVCYVVGPASATCTPITTLVPVSSGASRGLHTGTVMAPGDTEIDNNTAFGRELGNCQINPEPVPIMGGNAFFNSSGTSASTGTAFDSENLNACGADPGEPGADTRARSNTNLLLCAVPGRAGFLCEDNVGLPAGRRIPGTACRQLVLDTGRSRTQRSNRGDDADTRPELTRVRPRHYRSR